ncbi:MAG: RCC1 domain-containing protein [Nannocystales bacterium]
MRAFRNTLPAVALLLLVPACDSKEDAGSKEGESAKKSGGDEAAKGAAAGEAAAAPVPLKAVQVAAGNSAACALMNNGTARCWGRNNRGEHGIEPSDTDAATPVAVPGVKDATDIWMGGDSGSSGDMTCVRTKAGSISCWGSAANKPKTDGKTWTSAVEEIPELKGAKDLALGGGTQYAVTATGSVMAWGSNAFNSIGNGDTSGGDKGLTEVPGVSKAKALAAGQNHACALLEDGTVTCWGYVTPKQAPKKIEGLSGVVSIGAGSGNSDTCAVTADKKVQCWSGSQKVREESGLEDVSLMRARNHKCVMTNAGGVQCWGYNDRGQVGTGELKGSNGKKDPVVDLGKAVHVDVGSNFACAAVDDGNVKCWGWNNRGQLGDGTLIDRPKPVVVTGLTADTLAPAKDGADQAQESEVAMDWSGLPEACTKPSKITAKDKFLKGDFNVASAYATSRSDGKYVDVNLATFKMDPKRLYDGPRGKQFRLNLNLGKVDVESKETFPVDVGEYIFGLKQERKVASNVQHKSGNNMLMRLSLEGASPGSVSVAHMDDTWICGELKLKTKDSSFTGPWAARLVK